MNPARSLITLAVLIVLGISAFEIVEAVSNRNSTGILVIKTSDPAATIAISANNKRSQYLGLNSVKVRINQGSYLISATDQNTSVSSDVTVIRGQTTDLSLDINKDIQINNRNNKLVAKLPFVGPASEYKITYSLQYNNTGKFVPVFTVSSSSPSSQQAAQSWFKYSGFNLNDYQIKYTTQPALPANYNYFNSGH